MLELNFKINDIDNDSKKIILSTYINLGHLYRDETSPRIAINMYKNAIPYIDFFDNDDFKAQTYKFIGMTYMFVDNDSSLYYFDKCIEANPVNYLNKIDVDKCRATIYFDSGDKEKAFTIMKDNLNIIEHETVRESYYALLGDMYYNDKQYDSAICYLDRTFESKNFFLKLHTSSLLAAIYDSIGDVEKKNYYNGFVSEMALDRFDDESERSEIQEIYSSYKDEIRRINNADKKKKIMMITIPVLIFIVVLIIYVIHKSIKRTKVISNIIKEKEDVIQDMKFKHSLVEGKIRKKNTELQKQADIIRQQGDEIAEIRNKLKKRRTLWFEAILSIRYMCQDF